MRLLPFLVVVTSASFAATIASAQALPDVSSVPFADALGDVDCDPDTPVSRSGVIAEDAGLSAHPVWLCYNDQLLTTFIFWSGTNAEGTTLSAAVTVPNGGYIPFSADGFDETTQSNFFDVGLTLDGTTDITCRFVKPAGGISPENSANCF